MYWDGTCYYIDEPCPKCRGKQAENSKSRWCDCCQYFRSLKKPKPEGRKLKLLGSCYQIEKDFPKLKGVACCGSCHYEEEDGYSCFTEIETDDGYYSVCCGMHEAWVIQKLKRSRET